MATRQPICKRAVAFVKRRDGRSALAPLTGQDASAFAAFSHLVELYARADPPGREAAIEAMRATVRAMQRTTRAICARMIPAAMDWGDEAVLWGEIIAPPVEQESDGICEACGYQAGGES